MLNKLCKILFFVRLLLVTGQSYAIPPSLSGAEVVTEDKEVSSNSDTSIFDKFKQFFSKQNDIPPKSKKTKAADQEDPKLSQEPSENEHAKLFMDVGNATLPSAASNTVHTKNTSHASSVDLASHDINESNETEASEPFIDVGNATLPSAASNTVHTKNTSHASSVDLASHDINESNETEASEPFMDVGNATLPNAASNTVHTKNTSHASSVDLASHDINESNETEASEPFMDVGNATLPNAASNTVHTKNTSHASSVDLASHDINESNETEASEPFMDVGNATLPNAASNTVHTKNTSHASSVDLASHDINESNETEASEPFMDVGNATLPNAASNTVHTKNTSHASSVDLASHDINESNETEASEPFMDVGNATLPNAASNTVHTKNTSHASSVDLASHDINESNETEASEPFMDVGNATLPNAASNTVHTKNTSHASSVDLASHDINESNETEASEPFMDVGNATLPNAASNTVHTKNTSHASSVDLASHDINESNETEASEPFMDVGNATLPNAASNTVHTKNTSHASSVDLASHDINESNETEASEPFIDVGNATLPSAASNTVHTKNTSHASSVDLASHDINESNETEASEPFMDVGNATLPSAASNEMRYDEIISNAHAETNLASNITLNVPRQMVSMTPVRPENYVVLPSPPVHTPIPLNPPPDANKEKESVIPIVSSATLSVSNMPAISLHAVSTPVTQDTTSSTMLAIVHPAENLVVSVPAPPVIPTYQSSTQPIMPSSPNTPVSTLPKVVSVTNSSAEINNTKKTLTVSSYMPKKQDWNTPLIPVVVKPNHSKPLETQNSQATNNQEKSLLVSSPNVMIQEQDNALDNETLESATKFVKDETQMLFLPDDDIVLGKLTEQATLEQMDMYAYIGLFQKKKEWIVNAERRKIVESFIKYDYDINKHKDIYANLSYCSAVDNAFRAIDNNNISELRTLLDVYPILHEKNRLGETLLTASIYNDNYYLAKFLVIRGIKISTLNDECKYPLDIALVQGNANIECMLIKAKGYN
ncbi:hypothetical protein [Rickettsia oklahomensis]|uniref:Ankyrin repeat protein n=1 Tax=Rickettsia oklahomensis TaxID=3141789 RepID=A0AAU7BXU3_9RICK